LVAIGAKLAGHRAEISPSFDFVQDVLRLALATQLWLGVVPSAGD
jgi:hypothetical protein